MVASGVALASTVSMATTLSAMAPASPLLGNRLAACRTAETYLLRAAMAEESLPYMLLWLVDGWVGECVCVCVLPYMPLWVW